MFLDPQPTLDDTARFYSDDYMSKAKVGAAFQFIVNLWDTRAARAFVAKFGRWAAVLDYGSGDGSFLAKLRDAGCRDVTGYEPMPISAAESSADVWKDMEQLLASGKRFDVIRLHNSIEHLVDVDAMMTGLRGLLKPFGCISGETANGAHRSARFFGTYWGYLHYPYHTIMFSPGGLSAAARRWGYASSATYDTLAPGSAFTFEHLAKRACRLRRRGHLAVYPLLLLASAPFVIADRLLPGRTAAMAFRLDAG